MMSAKVPKKKLADRLLDGGRRAVEWVTRPFKNPPSVKSTPEPIDNAGLRVEPFRAESPQQTAPRSSENTDEEPSKRRKFFGLFSPAKDKPKKRIKTAVKTTTDFQKQCDKLKKQQKLGPANKLMSCFGRCSEDDDDDDVKGDEAKRVDSICEAPRSEGFLRTEWIVPIATAKPPFGDEDLWSLSSASTNSIEDDSSEPLDTALHCSIDDGKKKPSVTVKSPIDPEWNTTPNKFNPALNLPEIPFGGLFATKYLAHGSFGAVYQARQIGDPEAPPLAIKILRRSNGLDPTDPDAAFADESIALEEKILLSNHDKAFLASMFSAIHTPSLIYFVMPCYGGGDLFTLMRRIRAPLDVETARFLIGELVFAVGQFHSAGFLHRDIKLENIMLDDQGHVVLGDFGLSEEVGPTECDPFCARSCLDLVGTACYSSPEKVSNDWYGRPADWWAVGVVAYQLLTCRFPFGGVGDDLQENIVWEVPRLHFPDQRLDYPTARFLCGLLEKDPEKRLGSGPNGTIDVMSSPFFNDMNLWSNLVAKRIPSPLRFLLGDSSSLASNI